MNFSLLGDCNFTVTNAYLFLLENLCKIFTPLKEHIPIFFEFIGLNFEWANDSQLSIDSGLTGFNN